MMPFAPRAMCCCVPELGRLFCPMGTSLASSKGSLRLPYSRKTAFAVLCDAHASHPVTYGDLLWLATFTWISSTHRAHRS